MGYKTFAVDDCYIVHFSTGNAVVVTISEISPDSVFASLLEAIVSIEKSGRIISSVTKLSADGSRVRVRYRDNPLYKKLYKEYSRNEKRTPVAKIDYLDYSGNVIETVEFTASEDFVKTLAEDNYYGVPMSVTLYRQTDGSTISRSFVTECDPPLQQVNIVDYPAPEQHSQQADDQIYACILSNSENSDVSFKVFGNSDSAIAYLSKAYDTVIESSESDVIYETKNDIYWHIQLRDASDYFGHLYTGVLSI